jgi:hypothetical protein
MTRSSIRRNQDAGGHEMTLSDGEGRPAQVRHALLVANAVAALVVSIGLLAVLDRGALGVPALGPLLVPGHGAWALQFLLTPLGPLGVPP